MSGMGAPTLSYAASASSLTKVTVSISASYLTGINEFFIFYTTDGTTPTSTSTYFDFGGGGTATIDVDYGITFKCMVQNRSNLAFSQVGSITIPTTTPAATTYSYFNNNNQTNWMGLATIGSNLYAAVNALGIYSINTSNGLKTETYKQTSDWRVIANVNGNLLCSQYGGSLKLISPQGTLITNFGTDYWFGASADSTDSNIAYSICYGKATNQVAKLNISAGTVTYHTTANRRYGGIINVGNYLYAVDYGGLIYKIDKTTFVETVFCNEARNWIDICTDGTYLYSCVHGGQVRRISLASGISEILTGDPNGDTTARDWQCLTYSAVNNCLYVGIYGWELWKILLPVIPTPSGPAAPTASVGTSSSYNDISVTLSCETTDAVIHYTLDGTTPTSASPEYIDTITISSTCTLKFSAFYDGLITAGTDATYTLNCSHVVISLAPGTYNNAQTCTLTTSTVGASIYYTTDLSNPSSSKTLYTGAITVDGISGIRAIAIKSGYTNSGISAAAYTFTCLAPTINWAATSYSLAPGSTWTEALGANSITLVAGNTLAIPTQFYYNPVSKLIEWYIRGEINATCGIIGYDESTQSASLVWTGPPGSYLIGIDGDGSRYIWNVASPAEIDRAKIGDTGSTPSIFITNCGAYRDDVLSQLYKSGNTIIIASMKYTRIYYSTDNGTTWGYTDHGHQLVSNIYMYNSYVYLVIKGDLYKYAFTTSTSVTLTKVATLDATDNVVGSFNNNKFVYSRYLGSDTPLKYCNLDNGTIATIGTPILSTSYPTQICRGALVTSKYFYWFGADTIAKVHSNKLDIIPYLTAPQTVTFETSGTTGATNTYTLGTASAVAYTGETSVTIGNNAASETITATASKTGYASASASITMPIIRVNTYYAYTNGAWGTVSSASVYTGGAWKNALGIWKMISGNWTEIC